MSGASTSVFDGAPNGEAAKQNVEMSDRWKA